MTPNWQHCKNILVIRADNMGDLIMSEPAIRALKKSFSSNITLLTSSMAAGIVPYLEAIDDVIVFDLPWVKAKEFEPSEAVLQLIARLRERQFDAVVIFTVFSQNPLPAAMIAYLAGIPQRLAYCRENPYELINNWVPDKEPYTFIQHQVERDLQLVNTVGANISDNKLHLSTGEVTVSGIEKKLESAGIKIDKKWIIFHAGVSEKKREYPKVLWVAAAKRLIEENSYQVLFTGSAAEKTICDSLASATGEGAFSIAGLFNIGEFITLIKNSPLIVSVNTGTVHIAAAVGTPIVVLYAQTNPQHSPWQVPNKVLEFTVPKEAQSKNEIIQYLYQQLYKETVLMPSANEVVKAVNELLKETGR